MDKSGEETKHETERFAEEVLVAVSVYQCMMTYRGIIVGRQAMIIMIFLNGQDQKLDCRSSFLMTIQTIIDRHASRWKNWWPDVKDRKVESWGIEIEGHGDPGIWIYLVKEEIKRDNENVEGDVPGTSSGRSTTRNG